MLRATGAGPADVVVSGIPFALLSGREREELLEEIEDALAPGGTFIAFQYTPMLVRDLRRRFDRVDLRLVLANLPPAVVYWCRRGEARCSPPDLPARIDSRQRIPWGQVFERSATWRHRPGGGFLPFSTGV